MADNTIESILKVKLDQGSVQKSGREIAEALKTELEQSGKQIGTSFVDILTEAIEAGGKLEKTLEAQSKDLQTTAKAKETERKTKGYTPEHAKLKATQEQLSKATQGTSKSIVALQTAIQNVIGNPTSGLQALQHVLKNIGVTVGTAVNQPQPPPLPPLPGQQPGQQPQQQQQQQGAPWSAYAQAGQAITGTLTSSPLGSAMPGVPQAAGAMAGFAGGIGAAAIPVGVALGAGAVMATAMWKDINIATLRKKFAGLTGSEAAAVELPQYARHHGLQEYGISAEERYAYGMQLARAQGSASPGFVHSLIEADVGYGVGQQAIGLVSALARNKGGRSESDQLRAIGEAIGNAAASGLQRGRFGEMLEGVAQVASRAATGTIVDPGAVGSFAAMLGRLSDTMQGQRGFAVMQSLDMMAQGRGPAGGVALLAQGFGQGTDFMQAQRMMELGLFGRMDDPDVLRAHPEYAQANALAPHQRMQNMMDMVKRLFPEQMRAFALSRMAPGLGLAGAETLMHHEGALTEAGFNAVMRRGGGRGGGGITPQQVNELDPFHELQQRMNRRLEGLGNAANAATIGLMRFYERLIDPNTSWGDRFRMLYGPNEGVIDESIREYRHRSRQREGARRQFQGPRPAPIPPARGGTGGW